jgi:hypothetical protein
VKDSGTNWLGKLLDNVLDDLFNRDVALNTTINNIIDSNCTGRVVAGFYKNGSAFCETDDTGGGGVATNIDTNMYLNLESSAIYNTIWNITKSESKDYNLRVKPGRHFVFGGELI